MNKTAYQMTPIIKDLEQSNTSLKLYYSDGYNIHEALCLWFSLTSFSGTSLHFSFKIIYQRIKLSRLHYFYIFNMLVNLSIIRLYLEPEKYKGKKIERKNGSKEIFVKNKKMGLNLIN